jgi:hypothetical protein
VQEEFGVGRTYRVVTSFGGDGNEQFEAGEILKLMAKWYSRYDEAKILEFIELGGLKKELWLYDRYPHDFALYFVSADPI